MRGASLQGAVLTQLYLADMAHFAAVNAGYRRHFPMVKPAARACVQVPLPERWPLVVHVLVARQGLPLLLKFRRDGVSQCMCSETRHCLAPPEPFASAGTSQDPAESDPPNPWSRAPQVLCLPCGSLRVPVSCIRAAGLPGAARAEHIQVGAELHWALQPGGCHARPHLLRRPDRPGPAHHGPPAQPAAASPPVLQQLPGGLLPTLVQSDGCLCMPFSSTACSWALRLQPFETLHSMQP